MADDSTEVGAYPPLNRLKPVTADVWIVDGPIIRFGPRWLRMPFPTRMTVVRLGGDLFIHSPTELTPELRTEIEAAGRPRWIVGPNRLHFWWIPQWHAAFPGAEVYLAPRTREQAGSRIAFATRALTGPQGYPWDHALSTLPVAGRYTTEFVFFHHASRTLLLTDLIENFEARKLSPLLRWLTRFGGVQDPHGAMPRDLRLTFIGRRAQLRSAIDRMIAWNPERIILAHGRWYESNGGAELQRAFAWVLK